VTLARMCERCRLRPQGYHGRRWCYDCKPGNKGRPRPCCRCGSTGDYWSGGLCRRCHQYAPQPPDSCRDCLAWGVRRIRNWLCGGCQSWRVLHPVEGPCISCGHRLSLNDRLACRLCWQQTRDQSQRNEPLDAPLANRHGQQLMFANMSSSKNGYRPHPRRDFRRPAPDAPRREPRPAPWPDQLDLFAFRPIEDPARRYGFGEPPSLTLATLLDRHACEHAERHGWSDGQTARARIGLRVLQAMRAIDAAPIKASDVLELVPLGLSVRAVLAILDANGLLDEDRTPTIQVWFDRQLRDLPEPMAGELRIWFEVLHRGSSTPPRSRPRSVTTIQTRTRWALPALHVWADAGHRSLREVSRADVLALLPAKGTARATLGGALRSIFTTLKRRKVLFVNPTARISVGNVERRTPMPLDTARLREAFNSPDPVRAALTALIGIHGLRSREICALQLTDVRDGRVRLPDRTIPLAQPAKARLDAYLEDRALRWSNSVNPHFFIHCLSATATGPVQRPWVTDRLGMSAQALRQDRIVDEAHASGGDLRRICDFFGVTMATAAHYASTLNHADLAGTNADAATGSRTQGPS
jgi:integrase